MNSILPNDDQPLSDDELADLERSMELGHAPNVELHTHQQFEHQTAFRFIDELAAPIRTAIESFEAPPAIDEYEGLVEIARGGMGVVYRGLHKKTQRYDAVKVMRPDRLAGPANESASLLRLQFLRESQLAAKVAHEHIVPVYQMGESGGRPWFSMQLVDGRSLHELTRDASNSPERIVRYIEQIARAVDVVHRHGILHGDIKPQNILIEIATDRPLISDFGIADLEAASAHTLNAGSPDAGIAGTPAYMAPELAKAAISGLSTTDITATRTVSSDVYSLGATLWAALSGCSPCIENRTPREQLVDVAAGKLRFNEKVSRDIPPAVMRMVQRCVSPVPEQRYSTAGELADDLAQWLDGPRWNRHFPKLRQLLCIVVAPALLISGVSVQFLLAMKVAEYWIWLAVFAGYAPLFATFMANRRMGRGAHQAHRELWSIWIGHLFASVSVIIALRILCPSDTVRLLELFYPCWAAISSLAFFAKSGNFWSGYRWVGVAWSLFAIGLALTVWAPVLFGGLAATTCIVTARMDRSFLDE